jgi:hypothetical protein
MTLRNEFRIRTGNHNHYKNSPLFDNFLYDREDDVPIIKKMKKVKKNKQKEDLIRGLQF